MSADAPLPDFAQWPLGALRAQEQHLERLITSMAGQDDPLKPRLRAELAAARAELGRRAEPEWHEGWEADSRDADGNLVLRYAPTGGMYRLIPVED